MNAYFNKKEPLYRGNDNMWKLFVYCLIGEASAATRFEKISKNLEPGNFKKTLDSIVSDEIGHIHKAKLLLKADGKSQNEIDTEFRNIQLTRLKESWLRSGRKITTILIDVLLYVIYFGIAGIFSMFLRKPQFKKTESVIPELKTNLN